MSDFSRIGRRHPILLSGILLTGACWSSLIGVSLLEQAFRNTSLAELLSFPSPDEASLQHLAMAGDPVSGSAKPADPTAQAANDLPRDEAAAKTEVVLVPVFAWPAPIDAFRPEPVASSRPIPHLPTVEEVRRPGPPPRRSARRSPPPLFTVSPPTVAPPYLVSPTSDALWSSSDAGGQAGSLDLAEADAPEYPLPPRRPAGLRSLALRLRMDAQAESRRLAAAAPSSVAPAAALDNRSIFEMIFNPGPGASAPSQALAYAPADGGLFSRGSGQAAISGVAASDPGRTAVYDISARMVYLPDGTRLEAHSGLGSLLDDPRYAHVRMRGVTPPHLYALTPREALFHGVEALRLNPVGGSDAVHGRAGLLAHTYMLGPNGDSNGCVSIRDYGAFLRAYKSGQIRYLSVVSSR